MENTDTGSLADFVAASEGIQINNDYLDSPALQDPLSGTLADPTDPDPTDPDPDPETGTPAGDEDSFEDTPPATPPATPGDTSTDEDDPEDRYEEEGSPVELPGTSQEVLNILYGQLKEEGILKVPEDFEFDGTPAGLDKVLDSTFDGLVDEAQEAFNQNVHPSIRKAQEFITATGGSLEDYVAHAAKNPGDLSYDVESEEGQERILRDYYKETTSYTDAQVERSIDRFKRNGDLDIEAQDALQTLQEVKSKNEARNANLVQEAKEQQLERERLERNLFENIVKESPIITEARKNKVKSFINNRARRRGEATPTNELTRVMNTLLKNPQHIVQLADLLIDYDPNEGINTERFLRKKETKKAQKVISRLDEALSPKRGLQGTPSNKNSINQKQLEKWAKYYE